nr:MAG TPA: RECOMBINATION ENDONUCLEASE VII [Caudoviricetes sp.]
MDLKSLRVDHLYPHYRGGEDSFENYMPACYQCNFYKSTFLLDEFREQMSTLHERITKPFIARLGLDYGIIKIEPFDGTFYFEEEHEN